MGGEGTFHNTDAAAHTIQVAARSTFADRGPPLGWRILFDGALANGGGLDDDVEIPTNDVSLYVNGELTSLTSISAPITPPVASAEQPVSIDMVGPLGTDALKIANSLQLVWTFASGVEAVESDVCTASPPRAGISGRV